MTTVACSALRTSVRASLIMRLKTSVFFLCLLLRPTEAFRTQTWISSGADTASLAAAGVRNELYPAASLMHCLGLSATRLWAEVTCYDTTVNECSLWAPLALQYYDTSSDGTLGNTACKRLQRGKLYRYFTTNGS